MAVTLSQFVQYVKTLDLTPTDVMPQDGWIIYGDGNVLKRVNSNTIISSIIQAGFEVIDGATVIPATGYRRYRVLDPGTYTGITVTQEEINNNWVYIVVDAGVSSKELEPKPDFGSTIKDWVSTEDGLVFPDVRHYDSKVFRVVEGETVIGTDVPGVSLKWLLLIEDTSSLLIQVDSNTDNIGDMSALAYGNLVEAINAALIASNGSLFLENLIDVSIPTPVLGEVLTFNGSEWVASPEVTNNTNARHSHLNKPTLDKFGEDVGGLPTYNGVKVDTTIAQRDVYDGLDSTDNTISLSANNGKVLKDVQVTQQTAINLNTAKETNVAHPLVETAVPVGAVFTDTVYDDADVVKSVNGLTPDVAGAVTVGSSLLSKSFTYTSGAQTFTADFDIVQVSSLVVGNLFLQEGTQYTVSGAVVTILDTLTSGAVIQLKYWKTNAVNATNYTKAESDAASNLKEDTDNKSTSVTADQASNIKFPSVKSVYDWAVGLFATIANLALKAPLASPTFTGTVTLPIGTANKIPKYTSAGVLGDSVITELPDGSVGINTTSPRSGLDVGDNDIYMGNHPTGRKLFFGGNSNYFRRGEIHTTQTNLGIYNDWSGGIITLNIDFQEVIRINNLGNLGINTTSPSQKLEVVGNIKLSGINILGQYTTATRPAYVKGSQFFDTTINKMVIGGATAWEEVTSS